MKKYLVALFTVLLASLSVSAAKWEEGKHYSVAPTSKTNKAEVREYFSYYCPACRGFEASLPEIEKALPNNVTLEKTHVDFMGNTSGEIQFMISTAHAVAEKTGVASEFSSALFNHLQTKRQSISDQDDLKAIYVSVGGNSEKFDKGMKSFSIVGEAKRNKKLQDVLSKSRYLTSVPTFVVNGKYVINNSSLDRDNFFKEFNQLIAHLLTLD
ncbi:thiol:disulfide interchange protein DsbA/DsbL [Thalassotalea profundi]|uniref:Thiol:disulfide interchange protein n=1 Tax=Thalassotalea profundi TaxID=2036687 RepID=A0ABQ3J3A1_9GAMM|nr:thiol:disulfide interchange protein DsbA/DsbL [Thalassotalea profundi]GHF02823.1 thiol:disulfide interchange protein [Thalassotalea profundi]